MAGVVIIPDPDSGRVLMHGKDGVVTRAVAVNASGHIRAELSDPDQGKVLSYGRFGTTNVPVSVTSAGKVEVVAAGEQLDTAVVKTAVIVSGSVTYTTTGTFDFNVYTVPSGEFLYLTSFTCSKVGGTLTFLTTLIVDGTRIAQLDLVPSPGDRVPTRLFVPQVVFPGFICRVQSAVSATSPTVHYRLFGYLIGRR